MDTVIRFRVATEDKALFEKFAKGEGQSLSDWVRTQCFRAAATKPKEPKLTQDVVSAAARELKSPKFSIKPTVVSRPLTREEREAKTAEFQRKMAKK